MYQSILFPIDIGSIDSYEENFAVGKNLSNATTTKWHLIYVEEYSQGFSYEYPILYLIDGPRKDLIETLDCFADKIDYPRNQIKTIVRSGAVMNEILKYAGQSSADLIIIGRGRPTWTSLFVGPLAANLAKDASIPVFMITT
jgi:nucleotide-binding universal stress UspA family protein